jgi:hypothetical protein
VAVTVFEVNSKTHKSVNDLSFKPSRDEFNRMKWMNKAVFELGSTNIPKSIASMDALVRSITPKPIRRESKGGFGIYTFSVPGSVYPSLRDRLAKTANILSEAEMQDTSLVNIDANLETSTLASLTKDLEEMDKIRVPTDHDQRQKEVLRAKIRDTKAKLENLKTTESYLVYATLKPIVKSNTLISSVKTMGITFLKWLAIFFVGMVLVYYGTKLLMWLLGMMGVKGISAGGVGSSYQYGGYGNYANKYYSRYGYGGSHRKVKRVYKDKRTTETEENPPE